MSMKIRREMSANWNHFEVWGIYITKTKLLCSVIFFSSYSLFHVVFIHVLYVLATDIERTERIKGTLRTRQKRKIQWINIVVIFSHCINGRWRHDWTYGLLGLGKARWCRRDCPSSVFAAVQAAQVSWDRPRAAQRFSKTQPRLLRRWRILR